MQTWELLFLVGVIATFSGFAGVLACANWGASRTVAGPVPAERVGPQVAETVRT